MVVRKDKGGIEAGGRRREVVSARREVGERSKKR